MACFGNFFFILPTINLSAKRSAWVTTSRGFAFVWLTPILPNLELRIFPESRTSCLIKFSMYFFWSRLSDSNRPPAVYGTAALPDELSRHWQFSIAKCYIYV